MNINSTLHNGYRILEVRDHVGLHTELTELLPHIEQALQNKETNIALSFTDESYLSSSAIKVLLQCYEMITENDGTLTLLHPNKDIISTFKVLDLEKIIKVFSSLEELQ